jgi:hypothetical protein
MAYVAPVGTTKLVDAATVAAAGYSAAALVPIVNPDRPIVYYVSCNKAHTLTAGTVGQSSVTQAELDADDALKKTGLAATATYATRKYIVWPDAKGGYAWLQVQNNDGAADATITVYGGQI